MKLSNFTQGGRDNNFNLIRVIAALAVLITHSFALAIGTGDAEPFQQTLGMTMGTIAVDIFFITSGLLVTASLLTRQSIIEFIWARALRIFPALLIMLILTVFGLGAFFTSLPLSSYLVDSGVYSYFLKCATLVSGVGKSLPGVFDNNPYKNAFNGSLWTIHYEIAMYAILAVIWVTFRAIERRANLFQLTIVTCSLVAGILVVIFHFYIPAGSKILTILRLFFMFFSGAAFYVLKEHIPLSRPLFWLCVFTLMASLTINKDAFFVVYVLTIAYILFYVAYVPPGLIRKYNLAGDYSYGIYIYAFPIQQSVAALFPEVSVLSMLSISAPAALLLAALSWHLVERRALDLKGLYVDHNRKMLSYQAVP